ncbi:TIGR00300 family protein [Halorubrum sp. ASP1]|uniref:ornithine cyclodeaminase family domain n=1 Tax=Halorubrum sp. ASP1 TaxID=2518114 RepID=UPI0010F6D5AF|nr:TIGR00300 family protein [Halorubrum sp. ASP1]TKX58338.1 TIGR00300 family protein [Halorubrum sp. ASP1]
MTHSRTVELEGHIIDSGTMQRCFGAVMDLGGSFDVERFDVGKHETEESHCRLTVSADDPETLRDILHELHQNGAVLEDPSEVELVAAPADRVVPPNFYSTTNHPTEVLYDGEWIDVERIEMDCALVVEPEPAADAGEGNRANAPGGTDGSPRAYTKTLNAVEEGDLVATDQSGIRVNPPERPRSGGGAFGFMQGGVSAERPSESTIREVAEELRAVKDEGGDVMVVAGPAVIHSGAGDALADLVAAGYVDALSAGNGFATHDLERSIYGTSLGMNVETLEHPRKGHKHHIWTISEIIRVGGIEAAVAEGIVTEGVMYECVENDVDTVLAGSVRDDGPLPDTITDAVEAQDAIREQAHEADLVIMLATLLHSVAVGNCLPSTTKTVCVDIDPATVTQLLDRGSAQAIGMVTDIGTFVPTLAEFVLEGDDA